MPLLFCVAVLALDWKVVEQLLWRTEYKIIMDYNPSYPESWMYDNILARKDCAFIVTTYADNPHLTAGQRAEIDWMRENDPDTYRVYGLGQRGELRGQIYKNWKHIAELPKEYPSTFVIDWGYANDPACIAEFKTHNRAIYGKEHLYQTGLHNIHLGIKLVLCGSIPSLSGGGWLRDKALHLFQYRQNPLKLLMLKRVAFDVLCCTLPLYV